MKEATLFALGIGVTMLVCAAVVLYLRPHLRELLVELCGTEQRADFWAAFSNVALAITPLIFALHFSPEDLANQPPVFVLGSQLKQSLFGLMMTVLVLGIIVSTFIPRTPAPARAPTAALVPSPASEKRP